MVAFFMASSAIANAQEAGATTAASGPARRRHDRRSSASSGLHWIRAQALPWDDRAYDERMKLSDIGILLPYHAVSTSASTIAASEPFDRR